MGDQSAAGDCNDYVVTKRNQLLARGWPSHALLMAEVSLPTGKHHLVLVVVTNDGEFVLDNMNPRVRPMTQAKPDYKWVRMQSNEDPDNWTKIQ